ncbi:hypothetical protein EDC96DRAFT_543166 [Choanephora cucurbitarum]|nr:hypothetical protein EDC96DRAFT_543166 [Choanephora cucurbitarum]
MQCYIIPKKILRVVLFNTIEDFKRLCFKEHQEHSVFVGLNQLYDSVGLIYQAYLANTDDGHVNHYENVAAHSFTLIVFWNRDVNAAANIRTALVRYVLPEYVLPLRLAALTKRLTRPRAVY